MTTTSDNKENSEQGILGYEQVLFRGLSSFSNFAFGFTEVAVLVSFTSQYGYGLQTGGNLLHCFKFVELNYFDMRLIIVVKC